MLLLHNQKTTPTTKMTCNFLTRWFHNQVNLNFVYIVGCWDPAVVDGSLERQPFSFSRLVPLLLVDRIWHEVRFYAVNSLNKKENINSFWIKKEQINEELCRVCGTYWCVLYVYVMAYIGLMKLTHFFIFPF